MFLSNTDGAYPGKCPTGCPLMQLGNIRTGNKCDHVQMHMLSVQCQAAQDAVSKKLVAAAEAGSVSDVAAALDQGARVNQPCTTGRKALHTAVAAGHEDVAELLLAREADVNGQDCLGWTPLMVAAICGQTQIAALLLSRGAAVNAMCGPCGPLHFAAWQGHAEVAALLLERGAHIGLHQPRDGLTPLHLAAFYNQPAVAQLLLDKGADAAAKLDSGQTPIDLAKNRGTAA